LLIAVVGVAGILAFSVSTRTREFGIRLALGSQPENLRGVVAEGVVMALLAFWRARCSGSSLRAWQAVISAT
jgi:ABC-type antimicrobial peptide transport system permease subunit